MEGGRGGSAWRLLGEFLGGDTDGDLGPPVVPFTLFLGRVPLLE